MELLSETRIQIYEVIKQYISEHGRSPTQEEIGFEVNISQSCVSDHLKKLKAAGLIDYELGKRGTITIASDVDPDELRERKLTREKYEKLTKQGMTNTEIARMFCIPRTTLIGRRKKWGLLG